MERSIPPISDFLGGNLPSACESPNLGANIDEAIAMLGDNGAILSPYCGVSCILSGCTPRPIRLA